MRRRSSSPVIARRFPRSSSRNSEGSFDSETSSLTTGSLTTAKRRISGTKSKLLRAHGKKAEVATTPPVSMRRKVSQTMPRDQSQSPRRSRREKTNGRDLDLDETDDDDDDDVSFDEDEESVLRKTKTPMAVDNGANKAESTESSNLEGDYMNVALLLLLYFLQGVPMGISATLDLTLQEGGKLSYEEQGIYSSVGWPYSLKMLWAPLVDSVYSRSMGRRKTWLVPTQLCIGLLLYFSANYVDASLSPSSPSGEGNKPDVYALTVLFFTFYFLAATQDIAVDGWALEILQKRNLGWASTCNAIGLTAGYAVSFTGLMGLRAYDICDIGQFQKAFGLIFLATTFLVWWFKTEKQYLTDSEELSVREAYVSMWKVLSLPSVRLLVLALLTRAVAFAPADSLSSRKLLGAGMKKEALASLMALLTPLQIVLPGLLSKYTADRPIKTFLTAFPYRFALALLSIATVRFAPDFSNPDEPMPMWFWGWLLFTSVFATIVTTTLFISLMAFFAKVSDPLVGGSYMTTLNTATNLGNKWPNTLVLFAVNVLTWKDHGIDGYYVLNAICLALGLAWFAYFKRVLENLERLPERAWRLHSL